MSGANLDDIDVLLITALRENGRASCAELARKFKIGPKLCQRRVERLVASGAIAKFTIETYEDKADAKGRSSTYIFLKIREPQGPKIAAVNSRIGKMKYVLWIGTIAGSWDMIVIVSHQNPDELNDVVVILDGIAGVRTRTMPVIRQLKS